MSKLIDSLTHLLNQRGDLSTNELVDRASRIMDRHGNGRGWEYGPDFERQDIDAFAIAINWDLSEKKRLDRAHTLPREGEGWRIVAGLLPRDADQFVTFGGADIEASGWGFVLEPKSGTLVVQTLDIPQGQRLQIAENIVLAEIGEVNAARFITELKTTGELSPDALPFSSFARTFAESFPDCAYRGLLRTKSAGRTRREQESE
jgi:hypothetical protein